jgi:ABC-type multidrug transport system ATPase subunit
VPPPAAPTPAAPTVAVTGLTKRFGAVTAVDGLTFQVHPGFLRALAAEGRTVLVSSHVLSEVQQTADDVVVIAGGRLAYSGPIDRLRAADGSLVDSPERERLTETLSARGWTVLPRGDALHVEGPVPAEVGAAAHAAGLPLSLLAPAGESVEQAYLRLVAAPDRATGAAATGSTDDTRTEVAA